MNQDQHLMATSYQRTLIYIGLEDISAVFMLPDVAGGQGVNKNGFWVAAVARFLRLNLSCNFIEIAERGGLIGDEESPRLIESIYLKSHPEERPDIWMGVQFSATKRLESLLIENNILRWEAMSDRVSGNFIDSIFDAYKEF